MFFVSRLAPSFPLWCFRFAAATLTYKAGPDRRRTPAGCSRPPLAQVARGSPSGQASTASGHVRLCLTVTSAGHMPQGHSMRIVLRQRRGLVGIAPYVSTVLHPKFLGGSLSLSKRACQYSVGVVRVVSGLGCRVWPGGGGGAVRLSCLVSSVPCLAGGLLRRFLLYERRFVIHKKRVAADDDNDDDSDDDIIMMMMVMMLMAATVKSAAPPPHTLRPVFLPSKGETLLVVLTTFCRRPSPLLLSSCAFFWKQFSGANFVF